MKSGMGDEQHICPLHLLIKVKRAMERAATGHDLVTNNLFFSISFLAFYLLLCSEVEVVSSWKVDRLPGFTGSLPFELETGYISVDEADDVQLFYYFIKSQRNPIEDPLLLWLTGGPGCSAFSGIVYEIGPLKFKKAVYNGSLPRLVLNPISWTKVSNIIFVDSPVGTGFSYSTTSQGSYTGDKKSARHAYNFLRKWLIDHPEFLSNHVYIAGDSYSGITVPIIALHISDGIKIGNEPFINLKGYVLGNPVTDKSYEENSKIQFTHGMGIISNELYESTKRKCGEEYFNVDPSNSECIKELEAVSKCTSGLNTAHILEPRCVLASPKPKQTLGHRRSLSDNLSGFFLSPPPMPGFECRGYVYMFSYYWANDERVQKALNVRKGKVQEWVRCNRDGIPYTVDVNSSIKYHLTLSERGYRSLIYSGDHDLDVPFPGTLAWIKSLNFSIVDNWRPWIVKDQVAGYTRRYANNMTFATVKGGGHTAPEYKPVECHAMLKRWMSGNPL